VALNILLNYEDAEDACQEAFLKAYRNLRSFDLEKNFKSWFSTMLCNHCLDQIRKKRHFRVLINRVKNEQRTTAPLRLTGLAPDSRSEFRLLHYLKPRERTALVLWSQEGYAGDEIASVLGCSVKTAYVHLHKARKKLKALLRENENGKL
jgi:RNA polymerase sigma-70 factor (ECF subfamily)